MKLVTLGLVSVPAVLAAAAGVATLASPAADLDSLSGSGWVGAGLLGSVLGWVFFFHLPAKDKQLKDILDARDVTANSVAEKHALAVESLTSAHNAAVQVLTTTFREELREERHHDGAQYERLIATMEKSQGATHDNHRALLTAMDGLRSLIATQQRFVSQVGEQISKGPP